MTRYKHSSRRIVLEFDDMPGLEVVMRSLPLSEVLEVAKLADAWTAGKATPDQITGLFDVFANRLVSWNLDVDDVEVPPDLKGVLSLEPDLFRALLDSWAAGMTRAPKASEPETPDLPMEALR